MKTVLFSTSSLWNCGDDFIRDGVLELLQLKEDVRRLWWNRGFGISESYANDLTINLPLTDYFIVAGTPKWIFNNEKIYQYCLDHAIPLSIIGVGTKDFVSPSTYNLIRKVAKSGLCEIAMARDDNAASLFKELGFNNIHKILDPCFYKPSLNIKKTQRRHIVGWRDPFSIDGDPKLALRHPLMVAKKLFSSDILNVASKRELRQAYNRMFLDYYNALPNPKLVIVHDNREIAPAEAIFGKENVFYSTSKDDLFNLYSSCISYFGARIHGAIPAIIHGGSAHLIYMSDKSQVVSNAIDIIGKDYSGFPNCVKVDRFSLDNSRILPTSTIQELDKNRLRNAIQKNMLNARDLLHELPVLSDYLKHDVR